MGLFDRPFIVDYDSPEAMEADLAAAEASTADVGDAALDAEEAEGALPSKSLGITLDGALYLRLRREAARADRSISWLCRKAVEEYLKRRGGE